MESFYFKMENSFKCQKLILSIFLGYIAFPFLVFLKETYMSACPFQNIQLARPLRQHPTLIINVVMAPWLDPGHAVGSLCHFPLTKTMSHLVLSIRDGQLRLIRATNQTL